jgi:hypothetical protein
MNVSVPKQIKLMDERGAEVSVDLTRVQMDDEQTTIVQKLFAHGDHSALDEGEWDRIKDVRAAIRAGGDSELIVRFDWKWVKIDEAGRRFEDVINPGRG